MITRFQEVQAPSMLDSYIKREWQKNPNFSLSAFFRRYRMKVSLIGDYVVLKYMVSEFKKLGKQFSESQIYHACRWSSDYNDLGNNEKKQWRDDIFNA